VTSGTSKSGFVAVAKIIWLKLIGRQWSLPENEAHKIAEESVSLRALFPLAHPRGRLVFSNNAGLDCFKNKVAFLGMSYPNEPYDPDQYDPNF
jgi:hypothetical protein